MDESRRLNVEKKKPDTKKYMLCDSIYIKFKNMQNESMVKDYLYFWGVGNDWVM